MTNDDYITIRIGVDAKRALKRLAERESRTLCGQVRRIITQWLDANKGDKNDTI